MLGLIIEWLTVPILALAVFFLFIRLLIKRTARQLDAHLRRGGEASVYRSASLDDYPHLDAAFYEARTAELRALGFRPLGDVENTTASSHGPTLPTVSRLLLGDDGATVASLRHLTTNVPASKKQPSVLSSTLVDLVTTFTDGTFVSTSTAGERTVPDNPPEVDVEGMGADTPIPMLLRRHAERAAARVEHHPGISPVRVASLEEFLRHVERWREMSHRFYLSRGVTPEELIRVANLEARPGARPLAAALAREMRRQTRRR